MALSVAGALLGCQTQDVEPGEPQRAGTAAAAATPPASDAGAHPPREAALAEALFRAFEREDPRERTAAARDFASLAGASELPLILRGLQGPHADVRVILARNAHLLPDAMANEVLEQALADADASVVQAALMSARNVDCNDAVVSLLRRMLVEGDDRAREFACTALLWAGVTFDDREWKNVWARASRPRYLTAGFALLRADDADWWNGLVQHDDPEIRACAVQEAARRKVPLRVEVAPPEPGFVPAWKRERSAQREIARRRQAGWREVDLATVARAMQGRRVLVLGEIHTEACDAGQLALGEALLRSQREHHWRLGYEPVAMGRRAKIRTSLAKAGFEPVCLERAYEENNPKGLWWRDREIAAAIAGLASGADHILVIYGQMHLLGEGCFVAQLAERPVLVFGVPTVPTALADLPRPRRRPADQRPRVAIGRRRGRVRARDLRSPGHRCNDHARARGMRRDAAGG